MDNIQFLKKKNLHSFKSCHCATGLLLLQGEQDVYAHNTYLSAKEQKALLYQRVVKIKN